MSPLSKLYASVVSNGESLASQRTLALFRNSVGSLEYRTMNRAPLSLSRDLDSAFI